MLPPSHHQLASLHVAGVGNGGLWLVEVGVQGRRGRCTSWYLSVSPQVHKCPPQATHVHNLTYQALMIRDGAQLVVDFGLVR